MNPYAPEQDTNINPFAMDDSDLLNLVRPQTDYDKLVTRNAAMAVSSLDNEDLAQSMIRMFGQSAEQSRMELLGKSGLVRSQALDTATQQLVENPSQASLGLQDVTQVQDELHRKSTDPDSFVDWAVEDYADPSVPDDALAQQKAMDHMQMIAAKQWKDLGFFGSALDIGELFIPFLGDHAKDAADFAQAQGVVTDYFSSDEGFGRLRGYYRSLSPKEKQAFSAFWYSTALEAADNNTLVASNLIQMLTLSDAEYARSGFTIDRVLSGLDVAAIAYGAVKGLTSLIKTANAIRRAEQLGNKTDAVRANIVALESGTEQIAKDLGLSRTKAAANAQPVDLSDLLGPDVTTTIAKDIQDFRNKIEFANSIREEGRVLNAYATTVQDRLAAIENIPGVISVKFMPSNGRWPARIHVTKGGKKGKPVTKIYSLADSGGLGTLQTKTLTAVSDAVASPATKFVEDVRTLVSDPTFAQQQVHRAQEAYLKVLKDYKSSFKGLPKEDRNLLNAIIKEGDEVSEEYTIQQLKQKGLTNEKAISAYYNHRALQRNAWHVKSNDLLDVLKRDGFDKYAVVGTEVAHPVRMIGDDLASWEEAVASSGAKTFWVAGDKAVKDTDFARLLSEGYEMARFRGPKIMEDGNAYTYVFVKPDEVRKLEFSDIIPYHKGYVSNIHENAKYFLVRNKRGSLNGYDNQVVNQVVDRAFSSKQKLDEFIESEYGGTLPKDMFWRYDRDYDFIEKQDALQSFNGLFTGGRSKEGLIVDGAVNTDLADPITATAAYYDHLARVGLLEPMRTELKQRWLNTYKQYIPHPYQESFKDAIDVLQLPKGQAEYRAAKAMHEHISVLSGMRSSDELAADRALREFVDSTAWGSKVYNKLTAGGKRPLPDGMRAIAFHFNLGLFNPAQLLVQASGMAVTAGASPASFSRMALLIMRATAADTTQAGVASLSSNNPVYRLWRQSGFPESIDMQADFASAVYKGNGEKLSQVLFAQGELMNRRAAFFTAYDVVRKKLGRELGIKDLPDVVDQANRFTLNFTTANKAKWQDGWKGVIFQFQQVMEKSFNQIYNPFAKGSPLTKQERASAAAMQTLMFGALGIPLGEFLWKQVDSYVEQSNVPEELKEFAKRGVVGVAPIQNDIGSRMAIGQTFLNFWQKIITGQHMWSDGLVTNFEQGMMGPFGAVMARGVRVVNQIETAIKSQRLDVAFELVGKAILQMPTSTHNVMALLHYQNAHELLSRKGTLQYKGDDLNALEQTLIGLGFSSLKDVADAYRAADLIRAKDAAFNAIADELIKLIDAGVNVLDPHEYQSEEGAAYYIVGYLPYEERNRVLDIVQRRLGQERKDIIEKVGEDLYQRSYISTTNARID